MFKIFSLCLILLLLFSPMGAAAQSDISILEMEVDLWPEFDSPALLVIYRITLSPQMSVPVEIRLRIPSSVGIPNAVAARQPNGTLFNIPFTQEEDGDFSWLVFQATTPELQIEFYDPNLLISGDDRHFTYSWPGDYAVDSFSVEVQQPLNATDMRVKPGMVSAKSGADGLTYYTVDVGSLTKGQPFEISVDYKKSGNELTSSNVGIEPSAPLDGSAFGRLSMSFALPWALGVLGLLLIAGGGIWYWRSGRENIQPARRRHARRKSNEKTVLDTVASGHIYCHHCGKRASPGDRFCRVCGTQLRVE